MEVTKKILVVDDEETLCEALRYNLEAEGYIVDTASSAEEALTHDISTYDLILLDIMMGEISGLQLARILKSNSATSSVPIIFCTAKDAEDDIVEGLDLGADDYISKPYSLRTLMARVRTVLRRAAVLASSAEGSQPHEQISFKGLILSSNDKRCQVDGVEVRLPRKEFEILYKLMTHPGQIFSRASLLKEIWPEEVVVLDRVVDVNITRIRQKIGIYGRNIVTRSGYGYGFFE